MGAFSWWHWLIVLVIVVLLFGGKGKISSIMGDFGKGLKSFKKNMKEEADAPAADADAKRIADDSASDEADSKKDTAAKS
ncbi:twin-arginine translocase TatA/TatE family subunit [Rhodospirillaceae bacterium KN72]|uniref:Sec-independent protein translocase protein TatA n=1 Tax=Pacificispira spongiicola TaxID=2729598 RepID=A0A7Y0HDW6_9PROT|nr:twin-arginine translocase TatA/TatE family subunit [Pacificispira spongiicola]NMM44090.1 twin-arginine translocase TatA/TatE family subunit [Pacificispira spongiicola]